MRIRSKKEPKGRLEKRPALHRPVPLLSRSLAVSLMLTLGACQTASSGEEEAGLVLLTDAELAERFKSSAIVKPGHDAPMEMFFPGGHYQYLMPAMSAGRYWILNREVCVENKAVMEDVLCRKFGRNALGEIFEVSRRSGEGESVSIRDAARIEFQPF